MSGRFPGSPGVDELWANLLAGRPGLRPVTDDEMVQAGVSPAHLADPAYVRVGAPIDGIELFDAGLFGLSRREAEAMDPQHRLFLECAWEALESAGYAPTSVPGRCGVFAGCGYPDYALRVRDRLAGESGGELLMAIGNERDSLSSMVSYKLDLRGPSVTVQTFCSTSLVAVHLAAQSLLTYESDYAIAGGAYIALPQPAGFLFQEGGIASPDGRVRSFDAAARGTVLGNGVAVVALKRMTEALADGDPIHAVLLGSAVNNDGRSSVGYTAPGVEGQAEVIGLALSVAGVKPETIGYLECHATGTLLGDSIELAALNRVFSKSRSTPCVLGALKPSIGHLDRASGVTGLIRATLALRHRTFPGTAHFENPMPELAAVRDRFTVLSQAQPWPDSDQPRRAGVSSFGFGGTNAHAVLEEPPESPAGDPPPGPHLLVLSARDSIALNASVARLRTHLEQHRGAHIADIAFTLQESRSGLPVRWAVVCDDYSDALSALADPSRWILGETNRRDAPVVLTVPESTDMGAEWWTELLDAARKLVGKAGRGPGPSAADPSTTLDAVAEALGHLGVPVVQTGAEAGVAPAAVLLDPPGGRPATSWLCDAVARAWLAGASIRWKALHPGPRRRIPLPTYPFQRRRYWIEPSQEHEVPTRGKVSDPARWTYLPSWRQRGGELADVSDRVRAAGPWLVLAAGSFGEALVRQLAEASADVTVVRAGDAFTRVAADEFVVRPGSRDDFAALGEALASAPRTVVHAFSLANVECRDADGPVHRFDRAQALGWYSALSLLRALNRRSGRQPEDLVLLTDGAVTVAGRDLSHPEHATLAGIAPTISQENPAIRCRHVDIDAAEQERRGRIAELAGHVLAEAVTAHEGPVAWRGMRRWARAYEPQPLPVPATDAQAIPSGATVLITGGLGSVGLVLAEHLAQRGCRLVLTTRSDLPDRVDWNRYLADSKLETSKAARHVRAVLELERRGAEVLAMSADVADSERMAAVVAAAVARFGTIDAVVHGAGVQDAAFFGLTHEVDPVVSEAHFRAKVHGFHVLQEVLAEQPISRRITLSSLSTVLGGIMMGPYAAANTALDAYATVAREQALGSWQTVDWDAWRIRPAEAADDTSSTAFELTAAEGIDIFDRALAASDHLGHLVVSTGPLDARFEQWVLRPTSSGGSGSDERDVTEREPRPDLATPYAAPVDATETVLTEIWASALRIEKVGIDDDFFLLGGDSIVAIEMVSQIRKQLGIAVPVTVMLEEATVRSLAKRLSEDGGLDSPELSS
jgi:acyl transferase domain-containing protein/acyl carrier protein